MALKTSGLASKVTYYLGFGLYVFNYDDTLTFFLIGIALIATNTKLNHTNSIPRIVAELAIDGQDSQL